MARGKATRGGRQRWPAGRQALAAAASRRCTRPPAAAAARLHQSAPCKTRRSAPHAPLALVRLALVGGVGAHAAGARLRLALKPVVVQPEGAALGHLKRLQALALLKG